MGNPEIREVHAKAYEAIRDELLTLAHRVNSSTSHLSPAIRGVYDGDNDWNPADLIEFLDWRASQIEKARDAILAYSHVLSAGMADEYREYQRERYAALISE